MNLIPSEAIAANKLVLLHVLASFGIDEASITYAGSSDEGQVEEVTLHGVASTDAVDATKVQVWVNPGHIEGGHELRECSFREAFEVFLEQCLRQHDHDYYQDGDGGRGTLTLFVSTGGYVLEHHDYVTETVDFEHEG